MDTHELKDIIAEAWIDTLYQINEEFKGARSLEAVQVADFFLGKNWQEIDLLSLENEYIGDGSACLSFLSPEAYRYYLPAYMFIAIDHYMDAELIGDAAINSLTPGLARESEIYNWWQTRINGFTPKQTLAILEFLKYMATKNPSEVPMGTERAIQFWS